MKSVFVLLALGGVAANPVTKVIELIKELAAKVDADGVAEEKVYNKFACWCEKTTDRKAAAIEQGKKDVQRLGNSVLSLKGQVATLQMEIEKLSKDIANNEESQAKATSVRQQQASDFAQEKAEVEQTMNALERAVKVLAGAGTGGASHTFLVSVKATLTKALAVSAIDNKAQDIVKSFLEQGYSPQSETIQGILKDMYATFATTLESETAEEMKRTALYEEKMATLQEQHAEWSATKMKKEGQLADKQQTLADTTQELEDTTNKMNADAEFFDDTKQNCKEKSDEWDERHRLRAEELSGIQEALKILDNEDARKLFDTSIKAGVEGTSFVQVAESSPNTRAYQALQSAAAHTHNLRLAALAAKVKKSGHFDVVMKAIDEMIQELKDEAQDDKETRDECTEKTHKKKERKAVLVHKIERNVAKITKLNTKLDKTVESISAAHAAKKEEKVNLQEMTDTRADEHAAFQQAKSDDEAAIGLLEAATAKLSSYSEANAIDTGSLEGGRDYQGAFVQEPEFEVSEDQAPDAGFSGKGANKQEGKGIVSILTMLTEDLRLEVSNGVKAESAGQTAFEKARAASKAAIQALRDEITNLEGVKANTEDAITSEETSKSDNEGLRDDKQGELDTIKPGCTWMEENFHKRAEFRKAEMEGLGQAKSILAGAQASLLAKKSRVSKRQMFDDNALPSLEFKGFLGRN